MQKDKDHYHLFFLFSFRGKAVAFHHMFRSSEDALYRETGTAQSLYEKLQKACQNKINFVIRSCLSAETDAAKASAKMPEMRGAIFTDNVNEMEAYIQEELDRQEYPDLPGNAIARDANHLVLGIYANGDICYNVVENRDLISNYIYNTVWRFGRLIYTDGVRTYDGCIKPECLQKFDKKAGEWLKTCHVPMHKPSVPYR